MKNLLHNKLLISVITFFTQHRCKIIFKKKSCTSGNTDGFKCSEVLQKIFSKNIFCNHKKIENRFQSY